jgi:hypothetical protein
MSPKQLSDFSLGSIRSRIRLIALLHVTEAAGLAPLPLLRLHTVAFLSNVLAPVWEMPIMDGKILKRRGGPFYPSLQRDLDHLVGTGLVLISNLNIVLNEQNQWQLEGAFRLNHLFSNRVLDTICTFESEVHILGFLQELAYAFSALGDSEMDLATVEDATYGDPLVDFENVIDFAEWQRKNYSANAAERFENLLPGGSRPSAAEKIHLYVRHLKARLNAGQHG